jgi:DNA-binding response OmpR family regulator
MHLSVGFQAMTPKPTLPSVFIVEDDPIVSRLLESCFANRGFEVDLVTNGRDAISKVDSATPPDLIVLDIILPFFDGFDILDHIRTNDVWRNVPIIMLTSKTQEPTVVRAFERGADDYITKPFQTEELMARVRRLIR